MSFLQYHVLRPTYISKCTYTHILGWVSHCDTTIHGSSNCIGVLSAFATLHHNSWQIKAEHVASRCGSESYRPRTWSVRCWSRVDWPNHSNPLHQSWPDATSRLQTCQHSTLNTGKLVVVNIALARRLSNCAPHLHVMGPFIPWSSLIHWKYGSWKAAIVCHQVLLQSEEKHTTSSATAVQIAADSKALGNLLQRTSWIDTYKVTSTLRTWLICWSSQHQPLPNSHPTPPVPLREQVDSLHLCNRDESTATFILISPRWLMLVAHLKIPKRSVNKREMPHKWDKLSLHEIDRFANRNPLPKRQVGQ